LTLLSGYFTFLYLLNQDFGGIKYFSDVIYLDIVKIKYLYFNKIEATFIYSLI